MSQSFSYDLSVPGLPADAQARARDAVAAQMSQAAKMRLATESPNSLVFRPKWSFPLVVALFRVIAGETVKLDFSAADGETRATVTGNVGGDAEKVANRDFWAQTLGAD
jgi:hypothetical protein